MFATETENPPVTELGNLSPVGPLGGDPPLVDHHTPLDTLESSEKKLCCKLNEHRTAGHENYLVMFFLMGLELVNFFKNNQTTNRSYGEQLIKKLSHELGERAGFLYEAQRLATAYKTKDQIREITKIQTATGKRISPKHLECLVGIKDPGERQTWLDRCVANDWTAKQLREAKKRDKQTKSPTGSPRRKPPAPPPPASKTLRMFVAQFSKAAETWVNHDERRPNTSLIDLAEQIEPGERNEQLSSFQKLHEALQKTANLALKRAGEVHEVIAKLQQKISAECVAAPPTGGGDAAEITEPNDQMKTPKDGASPAAPVEITTPEPEPTHGPTESDAIDEDEPEQPFPKGHQLICT